MAEDNFGKLVRELSENPDRAAEFERDPDGVIEAAGLTQAERTLLLSGNEELILKALGHEGDETVSRFIRLFIRNIRFGV
jgi:hypothetical protein